jgi:hypothetical protein
MIPSTVVLCRQISRGVSPLVHWLSSSQPSQESIFRWLLRVEPWVLLCRSQRASSGSGEHREPLHGEVTMSDGLDGLLARAREYYDVPEMTRVEAASELLETFGAVPIPFSRYRDSLVDEFVDPNLVVRAYTLHNAALLSARATDEERDVFTEDPDDEFDPLEFGAAQAEWTTWAHQIEVLERVHILVERADDDADRVGNFRVYGAGQWLRETLWAATGVLPRDPGAPDAHSELFGRAFDYAGRAKFAADPISPKRFQRSFRVSTDDG